MSAQSLDIPRPQTALRNLDGDHTVHRDWSCAARAWRTREWRSVGTVTTAACREHADELRLFCVPLIVQHSCVYLASQYEGHALTGRTKAVYRSIGHLASLGLRHNASSPHDVLSSLRAPSLRTIHVPRKRMEPPLAIGYKDNPSETHSSPFGFSDTRGPLSPRFE